MPDDPFAKGCACVRAAIALSEDHKPNRTDERSRIEAAGGVVVWAGTWRVGGVLAVSRAFGDRLLKRYVVRARACARFPLLLCMHAAGHPMAEVLGR
jgi:serine/threonine protein phosphatase PrpC